MKIFTNEEAKNIKPGTVIQLSNGNIVTIASKFCFHKNEHCAYRIESSSDLVFATIDPESTKSKCDIEEIISTPDEEPKQANPITYVTKIDNQEFDTEEEAKSHLEDLKKINSLREIFKSVGVKGYADSTMLKLAKAIDDERE